MALDTITLADGQGTPVNVDFVYLAQEGAKVKRKDFVASTEEPRLLTVAHQDTKLSGKPAKSHLVRFDITKLDADGVTPLTANIRVMLDVPNAVLTDALIDDMAAFVRNFFTSSRTRLLARGSVF